MDTITYLIASKDQNNIQLALDIIKSNKINLEDVFENVKTILQKPELVIIKNGVDAFLKK